MAKHRTSKRHSTVAISARERSPSDAPGKLAERLSERAASFHDAQPVMTFFVLMGAIRGAIKGRRQRTIHLSKVEA